MTGFGPYYIAHGIELTMPLDIAEATYLCLPLTSEVLTQERLVYHAWQLQKWPDDLNHIHGKVYKTRLDTVCRFKEQFHNSIKDFKFMKGDLVLVCNNKIDMELDCKTKPQYISPMVVIQQTTEGTYILAEADRTLSKLLYVAKHLIPYNSHSVILGEQLSYLFNLSDEELYVMTHEQSDEACIINSNSGGFYDEAEADGSVLEGL